MNKPVRLRLLCGLLLKVVFPASALAQPASVPAQPNHRLTAAADVAPEFFCPRRALASYQLLTDCSELRFARP